MSPGQEIITKIIARQVLLSILVMSTHQQIVAKIIAIILNEIITMLPNLVTLL